MVSASLQLHMKDRSGPSVMPRGPVINNEGRRELGKSILERRELSSHTPSLGVRTVPSGEVKTRLCSLMPGTKGLKKTAQSPMVGGAC